MFQEKSGLYVPERKLLDMQAVGDLNGVMTTWQEQSQGEADPQKNFVIVLPGGMRLGVIPASIMASFQDRGFTHRGVQGMVTTSVGSTVGREVLGDNIHTLVDVFGNDIIETPQGRVRGIFREGWELPLVDFVRTQYMFEGFGAAEHKVKSANTDLHMGLRCMEDGSTDFYNAKNMDNTIVAAISSMTINFITERRLIKLGIRHENLDDYTYKMYADPFQGDAELINYAINKLGATDVLVLFTSNPFEQGRAKLLLSYAVTLAEHHKNPKSLLKAVNKLWTSGDNPEFYKRLFLEPNNIRIAGIFPTQTPMAPNDTRLQRVQRIGREAASFAHQVVDSFETSIAA